jgi:glucose/arabinose dehydrogenase
MSFKIKIILLIVVLFAFFSYLTNFQLLKQLVGYNVPKLVSDESLNFLELPEDFVISVFAKDLDNPRVIAFDPRGRMLVSETKSGNVVLLEDDDKNGFSESRRVIISGLNQPHGLDFFINADTGNTHLYIAESDMVVRYLYDNKKGEIDIDSREVIANYKGEGRHFTRTISFGPNYRSVPIIEGIQRFDTLSDIKLYISVGSSCDVCVEDSWKRGAILESNNSGSFTAEFAGGLRNSVFFTFHPITGEMWATEMGRDNLGDDLPPDEINIIKVAGPDHKFGARRYGWPFCYGDKVKDNTFEPSEYSRIDLPEDCSKTESPVIEIQAHSAPLGLAFINNNKWPSGWQNDLLVAYHGSWNRTEPVGYKVVRFDLDDEGNVVGGEHDFISGWLGADDIMGRPVDLKFGPDKALYISDDAAGIIYRVTH